MKTCLIGLLAVFLLLYPLAAFEAMETEEDIYEAFYENRIAGAELEDLLELFYHPVDLNGPDLGRLTCIPGIDYHQVSRILSRRVKLRGFTDPSQLRDIADVDAHLIIPFIRAGGKTSNISADAEWTMRQYLEEDDSYDDQWGIRASWSDHLAGELEMHHGETAPRRMELSLSNISYIEDLTVGSYPFSRGQKLVFGGAGNIPASAAAGYYGIGADSADTWEKTGYGSRFNGLKLTAGKLGKSVSFLYSSSVPYSLSRSSGDAAVKERLWGVNLDYRSRRCICGVSGLSAGLETDGERAGLSAWGPYLELKAGKVTLFAEGAKAQGVGVVAGTAWKDAPYGLRLTYRRYATDFNNPYSRGAADEDGDDNDRDEEGWTARTDIAAGPAVRIWARTDFWRTLSENRYHFDNRAGTRFRTGDNGSGYAFLSWEKDDLGDGGAERIGIYGRYNYILTKGLLLSSAGKARRVADGSRSEYGGYLWIAGKWTVRSWWDWEVKLKGTDYNISESADGSLRLYITEAIRTGHGFSVYAQYILTHYEDTAAPHRHRVRLTGGWHYN